MASIFDASNRMGEEIEQEFQRLIVHPDRNQEAILTLLQEHPTIDINLHDRHTYTLYFNLMNNIRISSTNPLLQEVMKRRPDPLDKGTGFLGLEGFYTPADKAIEGYQYARDNQNFLGISAERVNDLKQKALNAINYEENWKARLQGIVNLREYKATSKDRLLSGRSNEPESYLSILLKGKQPSKARPNLPENVEGLITEFLTGEKGPINVQKSKAYTKLGFPGVPTRGGQKPRKRKTRKSYN